MRRCDVCGQDMAEGYLVHDTEYYCCPDCLQEVYSFKEYEKMFEADEAYWTEWEEEE